MHCGQSGKQRISLSAVHGASFHPDVIDKEQVEVEINQSRGSERKEEARWRMLSIPNSRTGMLYVSPTQAAHNPNNSDASSCYTAHESDAIGKLSLSKFAVGIKEIVLYSAYMRCIRSV
ncbi:hypothetical protein HAX54_025567 [Datura stramonium]|uniref:Uncharacterized protein n=1 Tax=Datura stramonium TaxID=4076 RepID=A0ABS8S6M6_DATST|nr:hypothetical protein [Datura stramonium]